MSIAVITFPGSNCDRDCLHVLQNVVGAPARMVFHKDTELGDDCTGVLVPGGFSYGDYLRAGALAKIAPVMPAIKRFADAGGPVLGICNGFQILCEVGLLPGALMLNKTLRFISRHVDMRVESSDTLFTRYLWQDQIIRMPIAHAEGNFFADPDTLAKLSANNQIVFRYVGPERHDAPAGNPNGSAMSIAGIVNEAGNVLGMMPHPDRASEAVLGSTDGLPIFRAFAEAALHSSRIDFSA
ncbi:MAG: phosphoribosylformylglycinamidine synthase subunit PurQ [Calditrichaeota bacterium]|nr:phosphoribosylformylglycinamidine synthase subunit PurQ [Calditrichota bacterium]MCB9368256.1 phosphoribosylformylglycinamidine synthase subunit PurQ [Calditrichota bacterium]